MPRGEAMKRFGVIAASIALCLASTQLAAKTKAIGGARVIVKEVIGKLGEESSTLSRGDAVYENELISTGEKARAEFRFKDKTLLTLGEKSDIRLDAYVYNPRKRTGRIVLNSLKGAFRFVSGSARKTAYRIKTPLATIGVRGTVIDGFTSSLRQFSVFLLQLGKMVVCAGNACQAVNTVGHYVIVRADGSISKPKPWRGQIPGIVFETRFPAPGGRFYIEPRYIDVWGETGGDGSNSSGGGSGGGRGGKGGGVSNY